MDDVGATLPGAGLDEVEGRAYVRLLGAGALEAATLAAVLDIDVEQAGAVLEQLRARGFAARRDGERPDYTAVDPRVALGAAADRLSADAGELRRSIPELAMQFDRHRPAQTASVAAGPILTDPAAVVSRYAQLQHEATTELLVFDRPPYISSPVEQLEVSSLRKGVAHRAVYSRDSFARPGSLDEVLRLQRSGESGRVVPSLPVKFALADRTLAMVCLSLEEGVTDTLFTTSPPVIQVLVETFETYWSRGAPLLSGTEGASASSGSVLPRHAQVILPLMAAGATDDAIASHLGISVRSVRRRTGELMQMLGAETRLQFGVLAARRGLL